jgi:hypothetical protein
MVDIGNGEVISFPLPSRMIHRKNNERRKRIGKNTGGGYERHRKNLTARPQGRVK